MAKKNTVKVAPVVVDVVVEGAVQQVPVTKVAEKKAKAVCPNRVEKTLTQIETPFGPAMVTVFNVVILGEVVGTFGAWGSACDHLQAKKTELGITATRPGTGMGLVHGGTLEAAVSKLARLYVLLLKKHGAVESNTPAQKVSDALDVLCSLELGSALAGIPAAGLDKAEAIEGAEAKLLQEVANDKKRLEKLKAERAAQLPAATAATPEA